jgi:hypothetical protein
MWSGSTASITVVHSLYLAVLHLTCMFMYTMAGFQFLHDDRSGRRARLVMDCRQQAFSERSKVVRALSSLAL